MSKLIDIKDAINDVEQSTLELNQALLQVHTAFNNIIREQEHLVAVVKVYTGIWE